MTDTSSMIHYMAASGQSSQGNEKGEEERLERHLLLPVSKHSKAGAGVQFLSGFYTRPELVGVTLLHIPAATPAVWAEETSYESLDVIEARAAAHDKVGRKVVDGARRKLVASGFDTERIVDQIASPQMGKASDIVREAVNGRYDAVVLGRRAQVGLAEVMDQSVCRELMEGLAESISIPLWICRLPERGRKNVLLCVDGSDPSDRMADHVGFMLAEDPGHTVTVFHVHCPDKCDPMDAEVVVDNAVEILKEAGLSEDRIVRDIRRSTNPARSIEEEYDAGNYAAVAIGSSGSGRGFWDKLFVGSVAKTVFKELHGAALWVCF